MQQFIFVFSLLQYFQYLILVNLFFDSNSPFNLSFCFSLIIFQYFDLSLFEDQMLNQQNNNCTYYNISMIKLITIVVISLISQIKASTFHSLSTPSTSINHQIQEDGTQSLQMIYLDGMDGIKEQRSLMTNQSNSIQYIEAKSSQQLANYLALKDAKYQSLFFLPLNQIPKINIVPLSIFGISKIITKSNKPYFLQIIQEYKTSGPTSTFKFNYLNRSDASNISSISLVQYSGYWNYINGTSETLSCNLLYNQQTSYYAFLQISYQNMTIKIVNILTADLINSSMISQLVIGQECTFGLFENKIYFLMEKVGQLPYLQSPYLTKIQAFSSSLIYIISNSILYKLNRANYYKFFKIIKLQDHKNYSLCNYKNRLAIFSYGQNQPTPIYILDNYQLLSNNYKVNISNKNQAYCSPKLTKLLFKNQIRQFQTKSYFSKYNQFTHKWTDYYSYTLVPNFFEACLNSWLLFKINFDQFWINIYQRPSDYSLAQNYTLFFCKDKSNIVLGQNYLLFRNDSKVPSDQIYPVIEQLYDLKTIYYDKIRQRLYYQNKQNIYNIYLDQFQQNYASVIETVIQIGVNNQYTVNQYLYPNKTGYKIFSLRNYDRYYDFSNQIKKYFTCIQNQIYSHCYWKVQQYEIKAKITFTKTYLQQNIPIKQYYCIINTSRNIQFISQNCFIAYINNYGVQYRQLYQFNESANNFISLTNLSSFLSNNASFQISSSCKTILQSQNLTKNIYIFNQITKLFDLSFTTNLTLIKINTINFDLIYLKQVQEIWKYYQTNNNFELFYKIQYSSLQINSTNISIFINYYNQRFLINFINDKQKQFKNGIIIFLVQGKNCILINTIRYKKPQYCRFSQKLTKIARLSVQFSFFYMSRIIQIYSIDYNLKQIKMVELSKLLQKVSFQDILLTQNWLITRFEYNLHSYFYFKNNKFEFITVIYIFYNYNFYQGINSSLLVLERQYFNINNIINRQIFLKIIITNQSQFNCCQYACKVCFNNKCQQCQFGYYLMPPFCFKCTQQYCSQCSVGQFLNNQKCSFCSSNCLSCFQSFDNCTACVFGLYKHQNNTCLPCSRYCLNCSNITCFKCTKGFTIFNGSCISCSLNCPQCSPLDPTVCLGCATGMQLINETCLNCSNYCLSCKDGYCLQCIKGYRINQYGKCQIKCQLPCKQCQIYEYNCSSCYEGSKLNNGRFGLTCIFNSNCNLYKNCTSCGRGLNHILIDSFCFQYKNGGWCVQYNSSLLYSCTIFINPSASKYYKDKEKRSKDCNTSCFRCISSYQCTICSQGYTFLHNISLGKCVKCQSPCKTCVYSPNNCLSCMTNFEKIGSTCLSYDNIRFTFVFNAQITDIKAKMTNIITHMLVLLNMDPMLLQTVQIANITVGSTIFQGYLIPSNYQADGINIFNRMKEVFIPNAKLNNFTILAVSIINSKIMVKPDATTNPSLIFSLIFAIICIIGMISGYIVYAKKRTTFIIEKIPDIEIHQMPNIRQHQQLMETQLIIGKQEKSINKNVMDLKEQHSEIKSYKIRPKIKQEDIPKAEKLKNGKNESIKNIDYTLQVLNQREIKNQNKFNNSQIISKQNQNHEELEIKPQFKREQFELIEEGEQDLNNFEQLEVMPSKKAKKEEMTKYESNSKQHRKTQRI